ncbi:MAG: hypothetical protein C5B54_08540, partial [Acidobacteria bacterium]
MATLVLLIVISKAVQLNATTVALLFLLEVLTVSAVADLPSGIFTAVASGLLFNFYFLPPFGTFYIEAPENWVAFIAYTITAIVVSHFSATVRKRAREADQLQKQLSQLSAFTETVTSIREKEK